MVAQECDPHPPAARPRAAAPARPGLHFTGGSPASPAFCSGLGCFPPTRARPSSLPRQLGEDRAGNRAGKRRPAKVVGILTRLRSAPDPAAQPRVGGATGWGEGEPGRGSLHPARYRRASGSGEGSSGPPGAKRAVAQEQSQPAETPTNKTALYTSLSHRRQRRPSQSMRTGPPAHPRTRLARAADVVGLVRGAEAGRRDLPAVCYGGRRGPAPHFNGLKSRSAAVSSAHYKGGALRERRGCQRFREALRTLL